MSRVVLSRVDGLAVGHAHAPVTDTRGEAATRNTALPVHLVTEPRVGHGYVVRSRTIPGVGNVDGTVGRRWAAGKTVPAASVDASCVLSHMYDTPPPPVLVVPTAYLRPRVPMSSSSKLIVHPLHKQSAQE